MRRGGTKKYRVKTTAEIKKRIKTATNAAPH